MFTAWTIENRRVTMDIDMLARANNDVGAIIDIVREICSLQPQVEDGIFFDPDSFVGKYTQLAMDYSGVQLRFECALDRAQIPMKMDIGFSDSVYPNPETFSYPTILDMPSPKLRGYTPESLIAEKFQTILIRGIQNSRMKDFFDIWIILREKKFQGKTLLGALQETFTNRNTSLSLENLSKMQNFGNIQAKKLQWEQFLRKNKLHTQSLQLRSIIQEISSFLEPIIKAAEKGTEPPETWSPKTQWSNLE